jgi:hypothetical protein
MSVGSDSPTEGVSVLFVEGDKIHVAERRGFENDVRRHFVGEIVRTSDIAVLVQGWVFVYDANSASFDRHPELRTRVVSLVDARMIINSIPKGADLESTEYVLDDHGILVVTDGRNFSLSVSEFSSRR